MTMELYLFLTMDTSCKWVVNHAMPILYSWQAIEFLYDDVLAHWGKPSYIHTNNGADFAGSFTWLCNGLGIIYYHITIGKAYPMGR